MPKRILQKDAPILRKLAEHVPIDAINSQKIQRIIGEMKKTLLTQDDGVAIAAPQIGYSVRIFVVSKKIVDIMKESRLHKAHAKHTKKTDDEAEMFTDLVFINPVLKKISKDKTILEEGCLSVRYLYGKVSRGNKATVEAYNEYGKKFERGATGVLAQIFQHEIDHLNGILFIDKAKYLEEIAPKHLKHPVNHTI